MFVAPFRDCDTTRRLLWVWWRQLFHGEQLKFMLLACHSSVIVN